MGLKIDNNDRIADAPRGNWVDRVAPELLRPYLRLARLDRPIGAWLLFWPCAWGVLLGYHQFDGNGLHPVLLIGLFAIIAVSMRGAGCSYNDIIDREVDAQTPRTVARPIPSGSVTLRNAWIFTAVLLIIGHIAIFQLRPAAIILGVSSELLVLIYPFMKRITNWPQLVLGLAINWGAMVGWVAVTGNFGAPAFLLYAGGVFWTLGYDTIYAHQDRKADAKTGTKSSALRLGKSTKPWLFVFYGVALILWCLAGVFSAVGPFFMGSLVIVAAHFYWQIATLNIDSPESCLRIFKSNRDLGGIVSISILCAQILKRFIL